MRRAGRQLLLRRPEQAQSAEKARRPEQAQPLGQALSPARAQRVRSS
jgi:hypothetical protein